jgi:hypothetical protein
MIRVLFPPGCYGHYLTGCLYSHTNLNTTNFKFELGDDGSSHVFWDHSDSKTKIINQHSFDRGDKYTGPMDTVTIIPETDHYLDYINNQYYKYYKYDFDKFLQNKWWHEDFKSKLHTIWDIEDQEQPIPQWILREYHSFVFLDFLEKNYERQTYVDSECVASISTQDFFGNFVSVLENLCMKLKLNLDLTKIPGTHEIFLNRQIYHNTQLQIDQWIQDLVTCNTAVSSNPCRTFLDEIYVQAKLREHGYEIYCNGLEKFPETFNQMKNLIYKI